MRKGINQWYFMGRRHNFYPKIIVVQEISKEDAKVRIKELFDKHSNENIYPSEVAEKLHIDYDLVLEIVEDLLKEDEIEVAT